MKLLRIDIKVLRNKNEVAVLPCPFVVRTVIETH